MTSAMFSSQTRHSEVVDLFENDRTSFCKRIMRFTLPVKYLWLQFLLSVLLLLPCQCRCCYIFGGCFLVIMVIKVDVTCDCEDEYEDDDYY